MYNPAREKAVARARFQTELTSRPHEVWYHANHGWYVVDPETETPRPGASLTARVFYMDPVRDRYVTIEQHD